MEIFIKQVIEHPYWCVKELSEKGIAKRIVKIHNVSDNFVFFKSIVFEMIQTSEGLYRGIKTTEMILSIEEFYKIYKDFEKFDDTFEKLHREFLNTLINGLA